MRVAIYFIPNPQGEFWRLGSQILGYDAFNFCKVSPPQLELAGRPWMELVNQASLYGFHATLKAPFRLAEGQSLEQLRDSVQQFARACRPFDLPELLLATADDTMILRPTEDVKSLRVLADGCVRVFDKFRAPLSGQEFARRRPETLTSRQKDYLQRWGYPYVFEEFRFHMTLSNALVSPWLERFERTVAPLLQLRGRTITVDGIALFVQHQRQSAFRVAAYLPFG